MKEIPIKIIIDAKAKPLGRVASEAASLLIGKKSEHFASNQVLPIEVTIINAAKVLLTGNKANTKQYKRFSGYPGGLKFTSYRSQAAKNPAFPLEKAIGGMIPKNRLWKKRMKHLYITP